MTYLQRLERQMELFGREAIERMRHYKIAIIGLGGNGSAFVFLAVLAGFRRFILIDPDLLEFSNLNRFFGGGVSDVGTLKLDLVRRRILEIDPNAEIRTFVHLVQGPEGTEGLEDANIIISAVDNNEARVFLQKYCLKYNKPLLDLGSGCIVENNEISLLAANASFFIPGHACLGCMGLQDNELDDLSIQSFVVPNVLVTGYALNMLAFWVSRGELPYNFISIDCLDYNKTEAMMIERWTGCPYCGNKETP